MFRRKTDNKKMFCRYINIDKDYSDKELPCLFEQKENCCGCTACYAICPVKAIVMEPDEEGFLYPVVDAAKCVRCYKCMNVCAFKKEQHINGEKSHCRGRGNMDIYTTPIVYAVKHRDENIRAASRSGGVFSAVSDYILENNGVVYGCIMKDCYEAIHIRAEKKSERDQMRGSKYIQSNMTDIFYNIKEDANSGRLVLFSGTSCQVSALQSYLNGEYKNVFFADIVCHGVPSQKVWKDYIHWQESKKKAKCIEIDFRNKRTFGWRKHIETLWFVDKKGKKLTVDSKIFSTLFCGHNVLRPSCFKCPYKKISHPGDITLADFWGVDKVLPQFDDDKGISLLLINSEKGKGMIDIVKEQLTMISANIEDAMQTSFKHSWPIPETREVFWKEYSRGDFERIARKYGGYGAASKVKKNVTRFKNKVCRKLQKLIMKSRCSS